MAKADTLFSWQQPSIPSAQNSQNNFKAHGASPPYKLPNLFQHRNYNQSHFKGTFMPRERHFEPGGIADAHQAATK